MAGSYVRTPEHNEAMALKLKGYWRSPEHRAEMSAKLKGRPVPAERRAKISAAQMGKSRGVGRKASAETRAKQSLAKMGNQNLLGHRHSAETRAKMSAAHRGTKRSKRDRQQWLSRCSAAKKGKKQPASFVAFMIASCNTPEGRERMRAMGLKSMEALKKRAEYTDVRGRAFAFRSKWERRYARYLDKLGVEWEYESKRLRLSDGTVYVPDFWVPAWETFIEIKGWSGWRLHKVERAIADNIPVRLLDKKALTKMKVI